MAMRIAALLESSRHSCVEHHTCGRWRCRRVSGSASVCARVPRTGRKVGVGAPHGAGLAYSISKAGRTQQPQASVPHRHEQVRRSAKCTCSTRGANWAYLSRAPGGAERSACGTALTHHGRDTVRKRKNQV